MAALEDPNSGELHVLLALSRHGGSQSSTILAYLRTDGTPAPTQVNTFHFTEAYKCLNVATDGTDVSLVLVDSGNRVSLITMRLSDGAVSRHQITSPLPFYQVYASISPADKVAVLPGWDHYIFSVSDFVELSGERFDFEKQVGFLMGLEKNRITQLLSNVTPTNPNA